MQKLCGHWFRNKVWRYYEHYKGGAISEGNFFFGISSKKLTKLLSFIFLTYWESWETIIWLFLFRKRAKIKIISAITPPLISLKKTWTNLSLLLECLKKLKSPLCRFRFLTPGLSVLVLLLRSLTETEALSPRVKLEFDDFSVTNIVIWRDFVSSFLKNN